MKLRQLVKNWFKTGDKPTQTQFWRLFDALRFKDEKVPVNEVEGIDELLIQKADKIVLNDHINSNELHLAQGDRDKWNNKVDKEAGKGLSSNDFTSIEKQKLAELKNKTKVSEFVNDVPYCPRGNPLQDGEFLHFTPDQYGVQINKIGAIEIEIPILPVEVMNVSIYVDISNAYASSSKMSAQVVINFGATKYGKTVVFLNPSARIISSNHEADFSVLIENGENPKIFLGDATADFRSAMVSIPRVFAKTNGILTPDVFKSLRQNIKIVGATKFSAGEGTIYLSDNLPIAKKRPIQVYNNKGDLMLITNELIFGHGIKVDTTTGEISTPVKYNDFERRVFDFGEFPNGRKDLLKNTFCYKSLLLQTGFLELTIILNFIPPNSVVADTSFNYSIDQDLKRTSKERNTLITIHIKNYSTENAEKISTCVFSQKLILTNSNGYKYIPKTVTIDCATGARTVTEAAGEKYYDANLSEAPNADDFNKIRIKTFNNPFKIITETVINQI